jgi:hypothetical protein
MGSVFSPPRLTYLLYKTAVFKTGKIHIMDEPKSKPETPAVLGARACHERMKLKDNPYARNSNENAEWAEAFARAMLKGVLTSTSKL